MASLIKDLRRQLERTVAEARKIAEEGAEQSLKRLAVDAPRPHDALTTEEKKLRVSLRAHAKQLGDRLDERPTRLIQAVAYERWHQLLFARFLIENDLLLHPEHGVALSLDEVKELALAESREWVEVAAGYAQRMLLRRVFQPEDPALRVPLPPEKRLQLEAKLNSLPREVFLADDSLGWVYQFWQKDEKERVNKSEKDIGADELAAVTQLFTEDYIVQFLLHNTLGAWWAGKVLERRPDLARDALDENQLRQACAMNGYEWTYLRFVRGNDGLWRPVAGSFSGWPSAAKDIRVLDPCMGSGHFLVFALPVLVGFRIEEEGLSREKAVEAVLRDNLFGLEIDPRCTQIAAFNLAWTAWRMVGYRQLPVLNLASSGLGINAKEEDWVKLAGKDERARETMRRLYHLFHKAPLLGSLVNPRIVGASLFTTEFRKVEAYLERALAVEQSDESIRELAVAAQGLVAAARILADEFTLVATNVPYLGRGKQEDALKEHCERFHADAKADLATCFVERCIGFCADNGTTALVTPQNWLFLGAYKNFRKKLLRNVEWNVVARLGEHAFESAQAAGAFVALVELTRRRPNDTHHFVGIDVGEERAVADKELSLRTTSVSIYSQPQQLANPDSRVILAATTEHPLLSVYADCYQGTTTGDNPRHVSEFWELPAVTSDWEFFQGTVEDAEHYGGRSSILFWEQGRGELAGSEDARVQGQPAFGHQGVFIAQMRQLPATIYTGEFFNMNGGALVPKKQQLLPAIWTFCSSDDFAKVVRQVDQKVNVTNASLAKVPFDLAYWDRRAKEKYPSGLPIPYSADPSQWLFNSHPKSSDHSLQVAVARLDGYRWPRQTGSTFQDCPALGADGLEDHADGDGIVCLIPLAGKASAADRLRALLADAYGEDWSAAKLAELLGDWESLEVWLRDGFFEEHCQIFHQRPFVWHIWDGRKDGFHAIVNYHKLDHKTLEKLIYSSLGDWISRQRQDLTSGMEGADGRLAAAEHLQNELKNILEGECSKDETHGYDVFVRWKPLNAQPIGWDPDLNDGVRMNIRPWITEARLYRATRPGILRVTPNIKYGKDRGKEPKRNTKDFPWLNGTSDRNNDIHLPLSDKRRARGLA